MTAIVLIGPICAGKSTQGRLLSEALGLPQFSMDALRWDYYAEVGYDKAEEDRVMTAEGFFGVLTYWKPFEVHAVERLLADHPRDAVLDFGAGHSVYTDPAQFARVQAALAAFPHVVLLLPSPDLDESIRISKKRQGHQTWQENDFDELFVKHSSNHTLAKHVVYTLGKTPEQTRNDILRRLALTP